MRDLGTMGRLGRTGHQKMILFESEKNRQSCAFVGMGQLQRPRSERTFQGQIEPWALNANASTTCSSWPMRTVRG